MTDEKLPPELIEEREALIAEIYAAFDGVTREGGVSWSEARVIDAYGSEEECKKARLEDREPGWRPLIGDDSWNSWGGIGGWCFLDAVGFRYYLPAVLIRCLRSGNDEGIANWLTISHPSEAEWWVQKWSRLDAHQRATVQRFVAHMATTSYELNWSFEYDAWQEALDSYWSRLEPIEW